MKKSIGLVLLVITGSLALLNGFPNEVDSIETEKMMGELAVMAIPAFEPTVVTKSEYLDISPQQASQLMMDNPELVVVDVSPVYANGHLPGAVNYYV
ncbi:hypothetical protein MUP65_01970, partial [Patescibacteria group bacterium]|nr:hypothetical protein [Patescibacteria group bacterium]